MNPGPLSKNTDGHTEMASSGRIPEGLYPFQHDPNITEGSEFLDDAIRTKDQPLYETIEREINKPS